MHREWQYDEFCLVAGYLVRPLKSVELVKLGEGVELGGELAGYVKKRQKAAKEILKSDEGKS